MSTPFDLQAMLVLVKVHMTGPLSAIKLRFALDTGASCTVVNLEWLKVIGLDESQRGDATMLTTGSRRESAHWFQLESLEALGCKRPNFNVVGLKIPESAGVDGLLGLDFLREKDLLISFRTGRITLQ